MSETLLFLLNICFPYFVLDPIIQKLIRGQLDQSQSYAEIPEKDLMKIEKTLEHSDVLFRAKLGETNITIEEFLELEKGDILILDSKPADKIQIHIGDRFRFLGSVGINEEKLMIKITDIVDSEDVLTKEKLKKTAYSRGAA
jgi:flagellar motor switch protein FliM